MTRQSSTAWGRAGRMATTRRTRPLTAAGRNGDRPRPLIAHTRTSASLEGRGRPAVSDDAVAAGRAVAASRYPLYLMFVISAMNTADQRLVSVLFPLLKEEFRLSDSALGVLSGAFVVLSALAAIPCGVAVDRWTRTKLMAWGVVAWSFAELWVGQARSFGVLFASRGSLGILDSTFQPASYSLVNDYYPVEDRGRVLGVLQVAPLVGLGSLVFAGAIAEVWGWRAVMYAFAFPGFFMAMAAIRLPEPERGAQDRQAHGAEELADDGERPMSAYARMKTRTAFRRLLAVPTVWTTLLGTSVSFMFISGIGIWLPTFMVRYHDMSLTAAAGTLTVVAILGGGVGTYLGGRVADAYRRKGWRTSRVHVAAIAMVASAVLFIPAGVLDITALAIVALTLGVVLAAAPVAPLLAARADVCHPDLRGRLAALQAVVMAVSSALSPALLGWLSDAYSLRTAFLLLTPMMAAGGLIVWVLSPRHLVADEDRMRSELREERAT